jgi:two-component system, chemotaxis family, protein-glutamate methylesterase/glutaminase
MVPAPMKSGTPRFEAVVIGGSAGSVTALGEILPGLPASFPPVLVVVHVLPSTPSLLASVFAPRCAMRVCEAEASEPIEPGTVYFAPADYHLLIEPDRRCALSIEPPVHFSRPSIDVLFESAADVYRAAVVGVVLTGASADGALGLRAIHAAGGLSIVQDPATAESSYMPSAARAAVPSARVLPLAALCAELRTLAQAS